MSNGNNNNGEAVDTRARELAHSALAQLQGLREVLVERERNDERRWSEARTSIQGSITEIKGMVSTIQNSYRDSVDALWRKFMERIEVHEAADREEFKVLGEQFRGVMDWKDKVQLGIIIFLATSIVGLIGVIWTMVPHK